MTRSGYPPRAAWRRGRPVRFPLLWVIGAHLFAMAPDFAFLAGAPHPHWIDVFLGHITIHFVPGANLTLSVVFAGSLAVYLAVRDHVAHTKAAAGVVALTERGRPGRMARMSRGFRLCAGPAVEGHDERQAIERPMEAQEVRT